MTETTKTIFERHEIRKSKRQRADFRAYAASIAAREGYACHEEAGSMGAVNLVVGDPERAKVTYTAHYDTCARLPFPNLITPTKIGLFLLYQLGIALAMFLPAFLLWILVGTGLSHLGVGADLAFSIGQILFGVTLLVDCVLMMAGPANPHTANDNTSGVTTLLDLMVALPEELRGEVAFIFFDLEEMGMLGSAGYAAIHKKAMRDKLLINFDCVSDGSTVLFALRRGAAGYAEAIRAAFPSTPEHTVLVRERGTVYPSDQMQFPGGVGVAALKTSRSGILYMDRIHTPKDTVYEEGNMAFLVEGAVRLTEGLCRAELGQTETPG